MIKKIIYYSSEDEDFDGVNITPIKIDKDYKYIQKGLKYKVTSFIVYRVIAYPIAVFYLAFKHGWKVKNKKVLKGYKNKALFFYGNHSSQGADVTIPSMIFRTKKPYIIAHPNNVSINGLKYAAPRLGAIPLPDDRDATRNYNKTLDMLVEKNKVIVIYPEAHVWPYYTKIRNFKPTSFRYPIKYNTPVFCFTNIYKKRLIRKRPKMITYVDGPFFSNPNLENKAQEMDLRNKVYDAMNQRSKLNEVEFIKYIKKEE
ncbi:MAG: 1-acyl-sn-glycerol-3-phosphate acyltransferase [Anaeroplasmataceae bacterium]